MKLSVVISTYNRQESLTRTLSSVTSIADEIIVVDSGSPDETSTVARKFTKNVYKRPNNPMLNVNKNFGFRKATGDWILNLDDDEVVPEDLAAEIKSVLADTGQDVSGYWIPRKNIIFGKWIRNGLWWPDRQLRLFKRDAGKFPGEHVHEYIAVTGPTRTLSVPYIHYNYDSIDQYLFKMQNLYVPGEIKRHESAGYSVRWHDAVRFPMSDFLKIYFAQAGFRDGLHGLVLSLLQAFYSFLIFAKLWERKKFPETDVGLDQISGELCRVKRETAYWIDSARLETSRSPFYRLWLKLHRRYAGKN